MTACSYGPYTTQIILENHYFQPCTLSPTLFQNEFSITMLALILLSHLSDVHIMYLRHFCSREYNGKGEKPMLLPLAG